MHIITPQIGIILGHRDEEIIIASWTIKVSCTELGKQDLGRLEITQLTKISYLPSCRRIAPYTSLNHGSGGYVRIYRRYMSGRLPGYEKWLNGASPISYVNI